MSGAEDAPMGVAVDVDVGMRVRARPRGRKRHQSAVVTKLHDGGKVVDVEWTESHRTATLSVEHLKPFDGEPVSAAREAAPPEPLFTQTQRKDLPNGTAVSLEKKIQLESADAEDEVEAAAAAFKGLLVRDDDAVAGRSIADMSRFLREYAEVLARESDEDAAKLMRRWCRRGLTKEVFKNLLFSIRHPRVTQISESAAAHLFARILGTSVGVLGPQKMKRVDAFTLLKFVCADAQSVADFDVLMRKALSKLRDDTHVRDWFDEVCDAEGRFLDPAPLKRYLNERWAMSVDHAAVSDFVALLDACGDGDGRASYDDVTAALSRLNVGLQVATGVKEPIVDVRVTSSEAQWKRFERLGYLRVDSDLSGRVGRRRRVNMWLLYKNASRYARRFAPIVDLLLRKRKVDGDLVARGYVCVSDNVAAKRSFRTPQFLWVRRASAPREESDAIVNVAITMGDARDNANQVWRTPGAGYLRVDGALRHPTLFSPQLDVFVWLKPQRVRRVDFATTELRPGEPRDSGIAASVRRALRTYAAPIERKSEEVSEGSLTTYICAFNELDRGGRGHITRTQFQTLLERAGVFLDKHDFSTLVRRVSVFTTRPPSRVAVITREEFVHFLALHEEEIDAVVDGLRAAYGGERHVVERRAKLEELFYDLDDDNDNLLTPEDIQVLVEGAGYFGLTEAEVARVFHRFDADADGEGRGFVDFSSFLALLMGDHATLKSSARRQGYRITLAAEAVRQFITDASLNVAGEVMTHKGLSTTIFQRDGEGHTGVDDPSLNAWLSLFLRRLRRHGAVFRTRAQAMHPTACLDAGDINLLTLRLGRRLSHSEIRQLVWRISPYGDGEIRRGDLQDFFLNGARSLAKLLKVLRKQLEWQSDLLRSTEASSMRDFVKRLAPHEDGYIPLMDLERSLRDSFLKDKSPGIVSAREWVSLAQHVGAAEAQAFTIHAEKFLRGLVELLSLSENGGDLNASVRTRKRSTNYVSFERGVVQWLEDAATKKGRRLDCFAAFAALDIRKREKAGITLHDFTTAVREQYQAAGVTAADVKALFHQMCSDGETRATPRGVKAFLLKRSKAVVKIQQMQLEQLRTKLSQQRRRIRRNLAVLQAELHEKYLEPGDHKKVSKAFDAVDKTGKGFVNLAGFHGALVKLDVGSEIGYAELKQTFDALDVDGSGEVDYDELLAFFTTPASAPLGDSDDDEAEGAHEFLTGDDYRRFGSTPDRAKLIKALDNQIRRRFRHRSERETLFAKLRDKDAAGRGTVAKSLFKRFLDRYFALSDGTRRDVVQFYSTPEGGVDYSQFAEDVLRVKVGDAALDDDEDDLNSLDDVTIHALERIRQAIAVSQDRGVPFHAVFALHDESRDGLVSMSDFMHCMRMLGYRVTRGEAKSLVAKLAPRVDGRVDYEEFYRLLHPHKKRPGSPAPVHMPTQALTLPTQTLTLPTPKEGKGIAGSPARILYSVAFALNRAQTINVLSHFEQYDALRAGFLTPVQFEDALADLNVELVPKTLGFIYLNYSHSGTSRGVDYVVFSRDVAGKAKDIRQLRASLKTQILASRFPDVLQQLRQSISRRYRTDAVDMGLCPFDIFFECLDEMRILLSVFQREIIRAAFSDKAAPESARFEDFIRWCTAASQHPPNYSVNGDGFDGMKVDLNLPTTTDPFLDPRNVEAWYSRHASAAERREFDRIYHSIQRKATGSPPRRAPRDYSQRFEEPLAKSSEPYDSPKDWRSFGHSNTSVDVLNEGWRLVTDAPQKLFLQTFKNGGTQKCMLIGRHARRSSARRAMKGGSEAAAAIETTALKSSAVEKMRTCKALVACTPRALDGELLRKIRGKLARENGAKRS